MKRTEDRVMPALPLHQQHEGLDIFGFLRSACISGTPPASMVLRHGVRWAIPPLPADVQADTEFFVCRSTGQPAATYEEYLKIHVRLTSLPRPVSSVSHTRANSWCLRRSHRSASGGASILGAMASPFMKPPRAKRPPASLSSW